MMVRELRTGALWRAVTAELVGMTLFVFIGIASAVGTSEYEGPDQEVKVALAFGLAIATLAQSLGHVSGAHLNPAITVGLMVSCQISAVRAALYIIAQMLGAVLASGIVYGIRPKDVKALGLNEVSYQTAHTTHLVCFHFNTSSSGNGGNDDYLMGYNRCGEEQEH